MDEIVEESVIAQVEEETFRDREKHILDINIVSIVIGALVVITLLAWINALKALNEHTLEDDRKDRYRECWRKFVSAVVVTLLSAIIIIFIYCGHIGSKV